MNTDIQEELLWSWMQMSMCIRGNRLLNIMSFNEILICSILYRNEKTQGKMLTLTDLCEQTRLYKSQVNRILTELERKDLITRVPSEEDKRKFFICLVKNNLTVYMNEHEQVMRVMSAITEKMGAEKVRMLSTLLNEATQIVDQYQLRQALPQDPLL